MPNRGRIRDAEMKIHAYKTTPGVYADYPGYVYLLARDRYLGGVPTGETELKVGLTNNVPRRMAEYHRCGGVRPLFCFRTIAVKRAGESQEC